MRNMPEEDEWKLPDMDVNSQYYRRIFRFDFTYIISEDMKEIFKTYIWRNYRTGNRVVKQLYDAHICFRHFNSFAVENEITTFREICYSTVAEFLSYLRLKISDKTKKSFSHKYQKDCLDTLKSIIHWGQIHWPDKVPEKEIFLGNEYRGINKRLRIDFIPDEVLVQINCALEQEENCFIRYGIVILESTGMRLGDMLAIKTGCVTPHPINGYTMEWYDHKNRKARAPIPINTACMKAVKALEKHTKGLRSLASPEIKDFLFLHKPSGINDVMAINQVSFGNWIKAFIKKNNIRGTGGELYPLTAHKFRRTLATDMLSKGVDIKVIQEVLGHASVSVTKTYYADVKDKKMAETFMKIGIIGNISRTDETLIPDAGELHWFLSNKNGAARLCDGYCTRPVSDGKICERLLKRQKCYTCSRFITTVEDLAPHRSHLRELEVLMEGNLYGEHYSKHFVPVIAILKEIIRRLEVIADDDEQLLSEESD